MKNNKYFMAVVAAVAMMSSCSSYKKIKIEGIPGTVISVPNEDKSYTIDASGKTTVKLEDDKYYAFLLSQAPGCDVAVPFALNYKKNNTVYLIQPLAYGFMGIGIGSSLTSISALLLAGTAAEDIVGVTMLLGLGATLAGFPFLLKSEDNDVNHKYKYLKRHTTNDDLFVTRKNVNGGGSVYDIIIGNDK